MTNLSRLSNCWCRFPAVGLVIGLVVLPTSEAAELGTAFTFQGALLDGGSQVNDTCDFEFMLRDGAEGGTQIGPTLTPTATLTAGRFTTQLDFGDDAFQGSPRYLQIKVCCPTGCAPGGLVELSPRQELTPAPHAIFAANAGGGWSFTGNSGTTPGTNFVGTSDNKALVFKVNGQRALRLEPGASSPNVIGGYSGNVVGGGVFGATISGGGEAQTARENTVTADFGTVGGGGRNTAAGSFAIVAGGIGNRATGSNSTVGGGDTNTASGIAATVGGGGPNIASGAFSTVPGGLFNSAGGDNSFAAGAGATVRSGDDGSFVWCDSGGNSGNRCTSTGKNQFIIQADGGVGIGTNNPGSSAALNVASDENPGTMVFFRSTVPLSAGKIMLSLNAPSSTSNTAVPLWFVRGFDIEFKVFANGDVRADGTYSGPADFAEAMRVTGGAEAAGPGDVLVIDASNTRAVVKSHAPRSTLVAGIYSTRPGFLGSEHDWDQLEREIMGLETTVKNAALARDPDLLPRARRRVGDVPEDESEMGLGMTTIELARLIDEVPVAVVGIVPCKVSAENGPVRVGDLLVSSSTPGHAMRDDDPRPGTIVGKALEPLAEGTGLIRVLVTLQ